MEVDRKIRENIWKVKGKVYKRTSVSSTRLRQKNENKSRYIRLYNRGSTINGVWR